VNRRPDGPRGIPSAHPAPPAWRRVRDRLTLRTVALGLIAAGVVTCLVPVGLLGLGMWQENQLTQSWDRSVTAGGTPTAPAATAPPTVAAPAPTPSGAPAARQAPPQAAFAIRVPKIGYYAAVREGVSLDLLATGPGHYPTSSMPGGSGMVAIAAHNTFWIQFGKLGPGDVVVLETRAGRFTYKVTGTRIVNPDDRSVLVQTGTPSLVLTTCWPLWAGNLATQRLAIFAQQA
jgi:LPXTG-site transpeptidase (sortase) family protein